MHAQECTRCLRWVAAWRGQCCGSFALGLPAGHIKPTPHPLCAPSLPPAVFFHCLFSCSPAIEEAPTSPPRVRTGRAFRVCMDVGWAALCAFRAQLPDATAAALAHAPHLSLQLALLRSAFPTSLMRATRQLLSHAQLGAARSFRSPVLCLPEWTNIVCTRLSTHVCSLSSSQSTAQSFLPRALPVFRNPLQRPYHPLGTT